MLKLTAVQKALTGC